MSRLLLLLGFARVASAQTSCVAPADLVLGTVPLGAPVGVLIGGLGVPDTTTAGFEEDDGGTVVIATAHYGLLTVDIVRDLVDRLSTTDAGTPGPFGVRAGMERADVERRTGAAAQPDDLGDISLWVPMCLVSSLPIDVDGGLVVRFDAGGRATSVEIVAMRP